MSNTRFDQVGLNRVRRMAARASKIAESAPTDHGALTGLNDLDHPQYAAKGQNETIGGTWSFTVVPTSGGQAFVLNNDARLSDARTPLAHTHSTADITNLAAYTGLDVRYYTESEVDTLLTGKSDTSHNHPSCRRPSRGCPECPVRASCTA